MEGVESVIGAVREWMKAAGIEPYREDTGRGLLRHVVIRQSRSGETMVLLVAAKKCLPDAPLLNRLLLGSSPGFSALHMSVNPSRTNVILGKTCQRLFGENAIRERLLGMDFEISPLSFFQVNPWQTEKLYETAIRFACLSPGDTVVDAYAGTGTIALCMARYVKKVVGIELVPQAVETARRNARRNGVDNVAFHQGAVEEWMPRLAGEGQRPDVVVLDPPRKGMEPSVISAILAASLRRVVYVSCRPATQARDISLLAGNGYKLLQCQPVDMFGYAGGVENVAVLGK